MDNQNNKKNDNNNRQNYGIIIITTIIAAVFVMFLYQLMQDTPSQEISYTKFMDMVEKGEVKEVTIDSEKITIIPKMEAEKNQDLVRLTAYAPLFQNVDYTAWYPNLIAFNNHACFGIPFYHALSMLARSHGRSLLKTEADVRSGYPEPEGLNGLIAYQPGIFVKNVHVNGKTAAFPMALSAVSKAMEMAKKMGADPEALKKMEAKMKCLKGR